MICNLCPRRCNAERTENYGGGFCRMPTTLHIARAALHYWEEPVISGTQGSGAVFFSGCALRCVFCQNHEISADCFGEAVSVERLREIYAALVAQGAHNINLVTASHFAPWVAQSLSPTLPVPVVWNCGGYESAEILSMLAGKVQVYLPDLKYADNALAAKLSAAPDYFEVASAAIREMHRQVGDCVIEDGLLKRGVVIRHLVLPGQLENTRRVLDYKKGSAYHIDFDLKEGTGTLAVNGKARDIVWKRTDAQLSFYEADGKTPLVMAEGKTFVCLTDKNLKAKTVIR